MKDQIIFIPNVHMVKNKFKIIIIPKFHMVKKIFISKTTRKTSQRKTKKIRNIKKNKDIIKPFNYVAFTKKIIRFTLTNIYP